MHILQINADEKEVMFWRVARKYYNAIIHDQEKQLNALKQRISQLPAALQAGRLDAMKLDLKMEKIKMMALQITFYALIPLYLVSRVMTLAFPMVVIGYIAYFGLWTRIDVFQYVMSAVYMVMVLILLVLALWRVLPLHHALWHIAPGRAEVFVNQNRYEEVFELLSLYFREAKAMPVRNKMVYQLLGPGVAELILAFLPPFDAVLQLDVDDAELNESSNWMVGANGLQKRSH